MKSIKNKITATTFLIVLVALFVLGATCAVSNYSSTLDTLEQTMTELAVTASQRVNFELEAYSNIAYETGSIARLANPDLSVEEKESIVDQRANTYGFQRGNIINSDGISIFDGNDYTDRSYFKSAMQGQKSISEPVVSKITGELSIIVAAPLWQGGIPDTKVIGVVYFVPKETFLNDIVSSIDVGEGSSAYITNKTGVIIAHENIDYVKEGISFIEMAKSNAEYKELGALGEKQLEGKEGFGFYNIGKIKNFLSYAPIDNTDGWSLGLTAPTKGFIGGTITSIIMTILLVIISCIVSFAIAYVVSKRIAEPIVLCEKRLELLSKGDLTSPVPTTKSKDEAGRLLKSLGQTINYINEAVKDVSENMSKIAKGDLTSDNIMKQEGDFEGLELSTKLILCNLNEILGQINLGAEQVAAGAEQVSCGAQNLSQGATEQASSIEELAATINEISGQASTNAEHSAEAAKVASLAGTKIEEDNKLMTEMVEAMKDISETSSSIGNIIKTIEDIAFQTNILALNAAVEAARAGEAGKGFAVVADEVRNLANKSREAAKNTTALIESSMKAIENGTGKADDAAKSLLEVVEIVENVADIVNKISVASEEQKISISQVTLGIDQISSVVQTNSATAEQSAAASEELTGQSGMLKELVGRFNLKNKD